MEHQTTRYVLEKSLISEPDEWNHVSNVHSILRIADSLFLMGDTIKKDFIECYGEEDCDKPDSIQRGDNYFIAKWQFDDATITYSVFEAPYTITEMRSSDFNEIKL